jgi:O-antigen/teichoic acid export membrane protein
MPVFAAFIAGIIALLISFSFVKKYHEKGEGRHITQNLFFALIMIVLTALLPITAIVQEENFASYYRVMATILAISSIFIYLFFEEVFRENNREYKHIMVSLLGILAGLILGLSQPIALIVAFLSLWTVLILFYAKFSITVFREAKAQPQRKPKAGFRHLGILGALIIALIVFYGLLLLGPGINELIPILELMVIVTLILTTIWTYFAFQNPSWAYFIVSGGNN